MLDVRPELSYQVGATPEKIEFPRCGRDPNCLAYVKSLSEQDKPHDFKQKDPKWRFFWRIGKVPLETQFQQLNAASVEPKGKISLVTLVFKLFKISYSFTCSFSTMEK